MPTVSYSDIGETAVRVGHIMRIVCGYRRKYCCWDLYEVHSTNPLTDAYTDRDHNLQGAKTNEFIMCVSPVGT